MLYNYVLVDVSNLFYRISGKTGNDIKVENILRQMINWVENELKTHILSDGEIYFLFDVLVENYSFDKIFNNSFERKQILPDYKNKRKHSTLFFEVIKQFKKYYTYKGDKIKLVYSDLYEADDYVEPIIKLLPENYKIALISTDEDYTRYITDNIHLINNTWDKPYDKNEFINKFGFNPTPATVVLYKALFGDKSDNITGAIFIKKTRYSLNIKELILNFLIDLGQTNITVDEIVKKFKTTMLADVIEKTNKTNFEKLFCELKYVDINSDILYTFYNNIKVINSALSNKNVTQFIHYENENSKINDILKKAIFKKPIGLLNF